MPEQQKPAVFPFDISTLISTGRFADRFSYSSYFVPVRITFKDDPETPALTFPQKAWTSRFGSRLPDEVMAQWLGELGFSHLARRNHVVFPPPVEAPAQPVEANEATNRRAEETLKRTVADLQVIARMVSSTLAEEKSDVSNMLTDAVGKVSRSTYAATASRRPQVESAAALERGRIGQAAGDRTIAGTPAEEGKDLLLMLLQSEIGYLFLDRTRIRPKGFAVGEHIYSLSLAPAEEVTLEQRSFSKRTVTMEEANEQETTMDIELASTLTHELNESLDLTRALTDKWGFNISHTGEYHSPAMTDWGSIDASHTIGYTRDVTTANTETVRRSIRDSQTTSSKISARYRSLHKVTFNVKTETGFEATSKRVLRNQNRFTPVDYHFFKIMRTLELAQERYGVLLCWAPFVKSPAAQFFARLQAGKAQIIAKAETKMPSEPLAPGKVVSPGAQTKRIWSSQVEADKWGFTGDMSAEYTLSIPIPTGWEWDGNTADVEANIKTSAVKMNPTGYAANLFGTPWIEEGVLKIMIHVGAKAAIERGDVGKSSRLFLSVGATFQSVPANTVADPEYAAAFADYTTRHKAWEESVATLRKEAADAAETWETAMLANTNPVNELVNRLITEHFTPDVRDEGAEIELWQRIFQWDRASYVLYPGWWSDEPLRDPLGDPGSFFNASWARLFLPVRPGMEEIALRWIFSKTTNRPLDPGLSGAIDDVVEDLVKFREKNYPLTVTPSTTPGGCPDVKETYVCLGRWEETLPTDGTHIEVTQSCSLSIDSFAQKDLEDTAALRKVVLDSRKQDVALKQKAIDNASGAPSVEVKIRTDADYDDPTG